jgi:hypothetical protein
MRGGLLPFRNQEQKTHGKLMVEILLDFLAFTGKVFLSLLVIGSLLKFATVIFNQKPKENKEDQQWVN